MRAARVAWARPALVALILVTCQLILPAGPAFAANCAGNEDGIFADEVNGQGEITVGRIGQENLIRITGRTPDPDCDSPLNLAGSTANIALDFGLNLYIEVGWWRLLGTDDYDWFVEAHRGNVNAIFCSGGLNYSNPSSCPGAPNPPSTVCPGVEAGDYVKFKIDYNSSVDRWITRIACSAGSSTYIEVGPRWDADDTTGTPRAETFRFGNDTGMSDHHHDLEVRTTLNGWVSWVDNACESDNAPGYDSDRIADDHHDTVHVSLPDPNGC